MKRTKIDDRKLPDYTRGEEIFNMVSHIAGGGFACIALVLCCVFSLMHRNISGFIGGLIYGLLMIFVYTMSSVYHGLKHERPKKILQVLDHCSIYAMIVGTYMPIMLTGILSYSKKLFVIQMIILVVGTALGVTFTAIDFHRYALIAMGGYFVIGWSIIFSYKHIINAFSAEFMLWLLAGGIVYTLGMVFFTVGMKKRYFHSIFHLFIVVGSVLQFIGIFKYCIL